MHELLFDSPLFAGICPTANLYLTALFASSGV